MVILDHLVQEFRILRVRSSARREFSHRGVLRRHGCRRGSALKEPSFCSSSTAWRNETPFRSHHPVDRPAADLAGPKQCHRFFAGVTTREGVAVLVERAAAVQVRAVLLKHHPRASTRRCTAPPPLAAPAPAPGYAPSVEPPKKLSRGPGNKITPLQSTSFRSTVNFVKTEAYVMDQITTSTDCPMRSPTTNVLL